MLDQEIRTQVLHRDQWRCQECGVVVSGSEAHVHHKLPKQLGGSDDLANLITLCAGCHSLKHLSLHASLGRRLLERLALTIARIFDRNQIPAVAGEKLGLALRYLKVEKLRPGQLEPILAALANKSLLFISPTGSGKSLCFQIPALLASDKTLVISPLKALMADQVHNLIKRGVPATFINSDLNQEEMTIRLQLIANKKMKLIYLAPERLEPSEYRQTEQNVLGSTPTNYLVVDEAHCIDKWGDAFRPSYARIGIARKGMQNPPVLAFTATAGVQARSRITTDLGIETANIYAVDVDRPNIALARFRMPPDSPERVQLIKDLYTAMNTQTSGKALVFVPTKKVGNKVKDLLVAAGLVTEFFHGGLDTVTRDFLLGRFTDRLKPELDLLICTNAFGMGMDIPNIRIVFHWQHPASTEDYLQEFGRAGRDGQQSLAVLFTSSKDFDLQEFMIKMSLKGKELEPVERENIYNAKLHSLELISSMAHNPDACFTRMLLDELDVSKADTSKISRFVLGLAFTSKQEKQQRKFCCDGCFRKQSNKPATHFAMTTIIAMPSKSQIIKN